MDLYVGGLDIGGSYDNDASRIVYIVHTATIDVSIYYLLCMCMYIISVIYHSLLPGYPCGVLLDCVCY